MNREQIQSRALQIAKEYNYNGVICLDPGSGKSKVAIDCIKQGNFKNILITSPRTNLKENWRLELEKWEIKLGLPFNFEEDEFTGTNSDAYFGNNFEYIVLENIQTSYKWSKQHIENFDFIIYDEIHTCGQEYFKLIEISKKLNIPVLGLTGTPTKSDPWKKEVLYKALPIIYEYYNAEEDGITNSIKYWVYEYNLDDKFKVKAGPKNKNWLAGELTQYNYLSEQYEKAKAKMAELGATNYFDTSLLWMKGNQEIIGPDPFDVSTSNIKEIPIKTWIAEATKEQREAGRKFFFAVRNRKDFLWNLTSSKFIALEIKNRILAKKYYDEELYCSQNKVLLFSELTSQAEKLSPYSIHSNNGKNAKEAETINKNLLEKFNSGELRELSSCLSLTLGLNMTGANWAIVESFSSSNTNFIQKCKRLARLSKDEVANVIVIVPKGTQAVTWRDEMMKDIEYTTITNLNELRI